MKSQDATIENMKSGFDVASHPEFRYLVDGYSVQEPIKGICKSHAIWLYSGSVMMPLVYLKKPSWIKDDDAWKKYIKSISVSIKIGDIVK